VQELYEEFTDYCCCREFAVGIRAKSTFWIGYWLSFRPSLDMVGKKQSTSARNGTPLKLCYFFVYCIGYWRNWLCNAKASVARNMSRYFFSEGHFFITMVASHFGQYWGPSVAVSGCRFSHPAHHSIQQCPP